MSAFLVSDKTMHRVVMALDRFTFHSNTARPISLPDAAPPEFLKNLTDVERGKVLFDMNARAVAGRYSVKKDKACSANYVYVPPPKTETHIQLYKAVACLVYQCCEGSVAKSKQFGELEDYANRLAAAILKHTPEYDKAEWD